MISTIAFGDWAPLAMTEPARTLVQTVGRLEIRPRRSSVDKPGIAAAVVLIPPVPLRRMKSHAQYRRPWIRFANAPAARPRCKSRLPDATSGFCDGTPPGSIPDRRALTRSRQGRTETAAHGSVFAIRRWRVPP